MIGRIIGNYEVIREFGEGGMGDLYLGRHTRLAREVIIKTIRTDEFNARQVEHLRERLEREAFVQSQLDHPHIVRVYDFIATKDSTCMVMEYVPGRDLRQLIQRETGPLPSERAIRLFKQVLAAIDYAHNFDYTDFSGQKHRGIIHRDLKPANILVTPEDQIKVTDFGIVKIRGMRGGTQIGFNPGTPEYMSPEQALGEELDQRSDIYSLGIVFYEMLAGRVPFEDSGSGTSDYAIRKGHIELPVPPPSEFAPEIPESLERILLKALEKSPDDRYQSAGEFLEAIEEYEESEDDGLPSPLPAAATAKPRRTVVMPERPGSGERTASRPSTVNTRGNAPANYNARATAPAAVAEAEERQARRPVRDLEIEPIRPSRRLRLLLVSASAVVVIAAAAAVYYIWIRSAHTPPPVDPTPVGMVRIPGGEFMMGREEGISIERPVHKVAVKPFFIDETEVTNEQYYQFVQATRYQPPAHWENGRYPIGEALLPVVNVTWYDADAYCRSLGKRLPSEEEWEFAARGTDGRLYPYGNKWLPRYSNAIDNATEGNTPSLLPVKAYPEGKSPFGIFDMAGNALEWTGSDFRPYPGNNTPFTEESLNQKVLRGGAFNVKAEFQRATDRFVYPPTEKSGFIGFRCAKDAR